MLPDCPGFLASALGGGVAGRRVARFPASTLVAFVLPRFSPLTVAAGGSWLGDSGDITASLAWLAVAGLPMLRFVIGSVLAMSRKPSCMIMYILSCATICLGDRRTACDCGAVGACASVSCCIWVLLTCHRFG